MKPVDLLASIIRKHTEQKAGNLVRMAEGQGVTFKITKRLQDMAPVQKLPGMIRDVLSERSKG